MNLKEAYFSGVEDDKRVFENDQKTNKEGVLMKPFVPVEEVPDTSIDIEKEVDEKIMGIRTPSDFVEEVDEGEGKIREEIEIGFQEGSGVAHVGPDFEKVKDDVNTAKKETGIAKEEEPTAELLKKQYQKKYQIDAPPKTKSGYRAVGHDNLKTLKKKTSFWERLFRGKTREVFEDEKQGEVGSFDKMDLMFEDLVSEDNFHETKE